MKNYSTTVSTHTTLAQVQKMLAKAGVRQQQVTYGDGGEPTGLDFVIGTPYGPRMVKLPVRTDGVLAALKGDTRTTARQRTPEHAARVAWRVAHDWLAAQLALVEADLFGLDEILLPFILANDTQTAYEVYSSKQREIEAAQDRS